MAPSITRIRSLMARRRAVVRAARSSGVLGAVAGVVTAIRSGAVAVSAGAAPAATGWVPRPRLRQMAAVSWRRLSV